jgi:hypothetical protein
MIRRAIVATAVDLERKCLTDIDAALLREEQGRKLVADAGNTPKSGTVMAGRERLQRKPKAPLPAPES